MFGTPLAVEAYRVELWRSSVVGRELSRDWSLPKPRGGRYYMVVAALEFIDAGVNLVEIKPVRQGSCVRYMPVKQLRSIGVQSDQR
ncbi:MAG: hypothetical protein WCO86_07580 [Planctomycetota bacterium]